ncbi:MAG: heavy metal translocating P-type ATPase [Vicinamibacteria bacterium]
MSAATPISLGNAAASAPARPLCGYCSLPVAGAATEGPVFCCGGCALAHGLHGAGSGHAEATGLLMSVGVGCFLAMNVMMLSFVLYSESGEADRAAGDAWVRRALLLLATPALLLLGGPFLSRGFRRLRSLRLDTDALVVIGVAAAYALSAASVFRGEGPLYLDTAMGILLFMTIGRYLEAAARARTSDALQALLRSMPERALRVVDGVEEEVPLAALRPGDVVQVRPGERLPADGRVVSGEAHVSEAELTGESLPATKAPGDSVAACSLDLDGSLLVEVTRTGADTTLARVIRLVQEARAGGYPMAALVDRVAAAFVPVVLTIALGTLGYWGLERGLGAGLMNALSVLLIACPCAIGIAVPLAATAAAGRAASAGVLVRSGHVFERLARCRRAFLDKTGTLSFGRLRVDRVVPEPGVGEEELLALCASLEHGSEHPIGQAIRAEAASRGLSLLPLSAFRAVPGRGVVGDLLLTAGPRAARLGGAEFVVAPEAADGLPRVFLSLDGHLQGSIVLRDEVRPSAAGAIGALRERGIAVEVLSGDAPAAVAAFAREIPGLAATGGLLPEAKLEAIRLSVAAGELPLMAGDGINDAPALAAAAVGVSLESGTDLAREAADVTILGGDLGRLPWVIGLGAATLRVSQLNLFWAFSYNGIGLLLAVQGLLHPLFGALAMIASSLLVVLHSQRLARHPLPESAR